MRHGSLDDSNGKKPVDQIRNARQREAGQIKIGPPKGGLDYYSFEMEELFGEHRDVQFHAKTEFDATIECVRVGIADVTPLA